MECNGEIGPIVSKNCLVCHGADEANRKAKLRLDVREEALKPRKGGKPAIAPGHAENSRVIKKVAAGEIAAEENGNKPAPQQPQTSRKRLCPGGSYVAHLAVVH